MASYELVWAFAAAAPFLGAAIAMRLPDPFTPRPREQPRSLIARESLRSGMALGLGGDRLRGDRGVHRPPPRRSRESATARSRSRVFAVSVVVTRLVGGDLPDRIGPLRCAAVAAAVEALGLAVIALSPSLAADACSAPCAMGAAFATLYPSLLLTVVDRVPESRRGSAVGTFTAFFDIGVGLGGPLTGAAVALGGSYSAAFWVAAACAGASAAVIATRIRTASAAESSPVAPAAASSPEPGPFP